MRRELHKIPELDRSLPKTLSFILSCLNTLPCRIWSPTLSSLAAYFDFHQDHTLAFRSDMDALPTRETNDISYVSQHLGKMHACGHDGHMAMLLEFAQYAASLKTCRHNILLLFQPAEETSGGAEDICKTNLLKKLHTAAVFGIHLWPGLPCGTIASKSGALMAGSHEIHLSVKGRSAHIASCGNGKDALHAATELLQTIYEYFPGNEHYLLKFGFMQSGTAPNAISAYSLIKGSLRYYDEPVRKNIVHGIVMLSKKIEKKYDCRIQMTLSDGYPPLINHEGLFEKVSSLYPLQELKEGNFLTDDFSFYAREIPGLYVYLGTGMDEPLHSDHFNFDEKTLQEGVAYYRALLSLSMEDIRGK